ncbi:hypothetical protein [Romboutsia sp.]|uniref:hypothetical protein n=1 Tax=Romboutsia sp. TaxID=1965302 RepID=UPI003F317084
MSIIVNIVILSLGVVFGQAILSVLPPAVTASFDFILPALFGTILIGKKITELEEAKASQKAV